LNISAEAFACANILSRKVFVTVWMGKRSRN